jgi:Xaa-Pro aminopeptidase
MSSLEFTAKIEHGAIHLPKEFEEYEDAVAHVTITLEMPEDKKAKKDRLFAAFEKLAEANPFADIEDPVEWQRKLRDEWE